MTTGATGTNVTMRPQLSARPVRRAAVGGLAAVVFAGVALAPAQADARHDKKKVDHAIASTKGDLEDTSAALVTAYADLRATAVKVSGARSTLAGARAALATAQQRSAQAAQQLDAAKAAQANADDAVAQNAAATQNTQDVVGAIARQTYQDGGFGGLSMTLQAFAGSDGHGTADISDRVAMVDTVLWFQSGALDQLRTERVEALAASDHLDAVRRDVALRQADAQAAVLRARAAEKRAGAAQADLEILLTTQRGVAARFAAQKAAELSTLKKEQAQSDRLATLLAARAKAARERAARARARQIRAARAAKARAAAARTAAARKAALHAAALHEKAAAGGGSDTSFHTTSGGFLSYPVIAPMTSPFGMRLQPILHIYRLHAGIDLGIACGSPVHAAADGEVVQTASDPYGLGNYIVIDNGLHRGVDLATAYGHLSKFIVTHGHVKRGQVIALSGSTGLSTGCHLHFETRDNGKPVNPLTWLS